MIVGIDIGGSTTDAVILENGGVHVVTIEANDPVAAAAGALGKLVADFGIKLEDVECVAATGAGSRVLTQSLLGRPVVKVNEFTAIGIGGTSLAGKEQRAGGLARHRHRDWSGATATRSRISAAPASAAARCSGSPSTCSASRRSSGSRSSRARATCGGSI